MMRGIVRSGAGVALGVGLLVIAGNAIEGSAPDGPLDVRPAGAVAGKAGPDEASGVRPRASAEAADMSRGPRSEARGPAALRAPAKAWRAGARSPQDVPAAVVVRAANRRRTSRPSECLAGGRGPLPNAGRCAPPEHRPPAVEIDWNGPAHRP